MSRPKPGVLSNTLKAGDTFQPLWTADAPRYVAVKVWRYTTHSGWNIGTPMLGIKCSDGTTVRVARNEHRVNLIELDPEPYTETDETRFRHSHSPEHGPTRCIFDPRPQYVQDPVAYGHKGWSHA